MATSVNQTLIDRLNIADTFFSMAYAEDDRDWKRLRSLVTDPLHFDLSRHLGAPAQDISADDFIKTFQTTLNGFESTHHTISNVMATIDGDIAHGRASVVAYHYLPTEQGIADYCIVRGFMEAEFQRAEEGWVFRKISIVRASPPEGYPGLYGLAAAKEAAAVAEGGAGDGRKE
jgi:hypothetical protein